MSWRSWTRAIGKTLQQFAPEVLQTCVIGPVLADAMKGVVRRPSGIVRLAGVRAFSTITMDGAVIKGSRLETGAKFTLKRGLPVREGDRRLIIENEPHVLDGFSGSIKEGYGKGNKTLLWSGPVVVKVAGKTSVETAEYHFHEADKAGPHYDLAVTGVPSQQYVLRPKQIEINFFQGPFAHRRFSIVNTIMKEGEGGRMMIPMKDKGITLAKPDIRLRDEAWLKNQDQNRWILERKMDGSLAGASLSPERVTFRSHRPSGQTYYDKLPSLEFLSNRSRLLLCRFLFPRPSLSGTQLKGELVHPDGAAKMSGILNSHPDRARDYQAKNGDAEYFAWDIVRYKGRDVTNWDYARRRGLLEKVIGEIRRFNPSYHIVDQARPGELSPDYYRRVIGDRRGLPYAEGVVLKDRRASQNWFKIKASNDHDLPVAGFVEGTGKYAGSLGALQVINPTTGEVGEVGSFAVDNETRQWIWQHRYALKGAFARIKAMDLTERGVPRAGVFQDFHSEKGSEEALTALASREL